MLYGKCLNGQWTHWVGGWVSLVIWQLIERDFLPHYRVHTILISVRLHSAYSVSGICFIDSACHRIRTRGLRFTLGQCEMCEWWFMNPNPVKWGYWVTSGITTVFAMFRGINRREDNKMQFCEKYHSHANKIIFTGNWRAVNRCVIINFNSWIVEWILLITFLFLKYIRIRIDSRC